MDLNITWFLLIGVLLTGYAILDGFDLGVGVLHLFSKNENERKININSIGPLWDGNEVWLLTGSGAMFAAFPIVYATVFSGFYLAFMLLLAALIFRATSFEFRSQVESKRWKRFWDWAFGLGSAVPALLYGVAWGNILRGIPIDQNYMFTGNFIGLLNPFSLLVGVVTLSMFTMHGGLWLAIKTEGEYRNDVLKRTKTAGMIFIVTYILATIYAIATSPHLFAGAAGKPLFWLAVIVMVAGLIYTQVAMGKKKYLHSFIASSVTMIGMVGLSGVSLFPRMVPSITNLDYSLDIYNASSTNPTLMTMLIVALIGMPLVLLYQGYIYWVFKGKASATEDGY